MVPYPVIQFLLFAADLNAPRALSDDVVIPSPITRGAANTEEENHQRHSGRHKPVQQRLGRSQGLDHNRLQQRTEPRSTAL